MLMGCRVRNVCGDRQGTVVAVDGSAFEVRWDDASGTWWVAGTELGLLDLCDDEAYWQDVALLDTQRADREAMA